MDKRNRNRITWGFVILTVLIVTVMLLNTLHRSGHITLPEPGAGADQNQEGSGVDDDALSVVEITPQTVQTAIATLARPESYRRTVTVQQFWTGGSGSYDTAVAVYGPWTRTDRTMPDGQVRHTITGTDTVYIWYNNETEYFTGAAGSISPDNEQSIPTYEEILQLPTEAITAADYQTVSDVACIYTQAETDGGYTLRYWVSVDSGLLVAAEKILQEETVYYMEALSVDLTEQTPEQFTLPDGTVLVEAAS